MGTEYCLGRHETVKTPAGTGICLMAYEMSGLFDVYVDLPRDRIDNAAWEDCARVLLWEAVSPEELLRMGETIVKTASWHLDPSQLPQEKDEPKPAEYGAVIKNRHKLLGVDLPFSDWDFCIPEKVLNPKLSQVEIFEELKPAYLFSSNPPAKAEAMRSGDYFSIVRYTLLTELIAAADAEFIYNYNQTQLQNKEGD